MASTTVLLCRAALGDEGEVQQILAQLVVIGDAAEHGLPLFLRKGTQGSEEHLSSRFGLAH
jgi:hypothetical protein